MHVKYNWKSFESLPSSFFCRTIHCANSDGLGIKACLSMAAPCTHGPWSFIGCCTREETEQSRYSSSQVAAGALVNYAFYNHIKPCVGRVADSTMHVREATLLRYDDVFGVKRVQASEFRISAEPKKQSKKKKSTRDQFYSQRWEKIVVAVLIWEDCNSEQRGQTNTRTLTWARRRLSNGEKPCTVSQGGVTRRITPSA